MTQSWPRPVPDFTAAFAGLAVTVGASACFGVAAGAGVGVDVFAGAELGAGLGAGASATAGAGGMATTANRSSDHCLRESGKNFSSASRLNSLRNSLDICRSVRTSAQGGKIPGNGATGTARIATGAICSGRSGADGDGGGWDTAASTAGLLGSV